MSDVVSKLWGFCHTLRHDGIDYGDYIEQITFLLFLKMADEKRIDIPKGCDWPALRDKAGSDLTDFYVDLLRTLAKQKGMLGDIFAESQSRFNNPVNLKRLINLVDEIEWTSLGVDVKAAAYEGLLEQAANEGKKGAGQYFTPRVLIQSIVRVMKPDARASREFKVCDPACGTGGFLVAAHEWLVAPVKSGGAGAAAMEREVAKRVRNQTYFAQELVARPRRMALMNLFLHGVEPHQQCLAHILRRIHEFLETAVGGAVVFPRAVKDLLKEGLAVRDRHVLGEISDHGKLVRAGQLEGALARLVAPVKTNPDNERLASFPEKHLESLFTFLKVDGVEATNWPGEQAIRPAVVNRKVWGGNRTEAGANAQSVLTSVIVTCKQLVVDPLQFLTNTLCSKTPIPLFGEMGR